MTNVLLLFISILLTVKPSHGDPANMDPMKCSRSSPIQTCKSTLYIPSYNGLSKSNVASIYTANISLIDTIVRQQKRTDFLAQVPCKCEDIGDGISAYFHDTNYTVKAGDSSDSLTNTEFSGLAWDITATLDPGQNLTVHLLCGCDANSNLNSNDSKDIMSYTVQKGDTLSSIANLFLADLEITKSLNVKILVDPNFLRPGWVLFVPIGTAKDGDIKPGNKKKDSTALILGITFSIAFILLGVILAIYRNWKQSHKKTSELPKKMERNTSLMSIAALENQYHHKDNMQDIEQTNTERPIIFSLSDVEKATLNFDETRMIGEGGFGRVYYGMLGNQEVAIKRMKSSKSKEFFAELKVLCKIHHINVVELIGYASGDDHLYLVYEYVRYGSLNDHLHDPLLKGHQPLSWNARAQIALDAARGIEYIHDHTKAHYVHRDIKTSNILLDEGLRAKVADFGLVKLVERSSEDDFMATRLVGTPGYLPPESVRELQMTSKGDVFAFGVVLAELITGCHALMRDNKETSKMKSLISVMRKVFEADDPEPELEAIVDGYLGDSYPMEQVYKMAEISVWCLDEEPVDRPEMREITIELSQIVMATKEWEASLAGNGQVFSGVFNGR